MYTVKNGTVSGAIELYFSEKPGTETRGAGNRKKIFS